MYFFRTLIFSASDLCVNEMPSWHVCDATQVHFVASGTQCSDYNGKFKVVLYGDRYFV